MNRPVSYFVQSKAYGRASEDVVSLGQGFSAVLDGATDTANAWVRCRGREVTPGLCVALCVSEELLKIYPDAPTPREALDHVTEKIARVGSGGRASVAVFDHRAHIAWAVGDCKVRIEDRQYSWPKRIDQELAEERARILQAELARGKRVEDLQINDVGRAAILPAIGEQWQWANTAHPLGFGVLDGQKVLDAHLWTGEVGESGVILATDGYPELLPSRAESDSRLSQLLKLDPLCIGELRGTKGLSPNARSYDDRAWVTVDKPGRGT